jgi:predicted GTPase
MPYGDLTRQRVERFAAPADLDRFRCTIEEREEYAPYLELGLTVYAGVDYASILREAEIEADVILWDGGNNDFPFISPDTSIVVADALRPGHELEYYPGETNLLQADVVAINKVQKALPASIAMIRDHVQRHNSQAAIIESDLEIEVDRPELIAGRSVLVIEDGPTLTHGGMAHGAGLLAASKFGAREIVDPRPHSVGSIAAAYRDYPHIDKVLPALGYSETQRNELAATINASSAEVVVDASPAALEGFLLLDKPVVRVRYRFHQTAGTPVETIVEEHLTKMTAGFDKSESHRATNAS